jgi:hypothetical protein
MGSGQAELSLQQLHLNDTTKSAVQLLSDGYGSSSCASSGNASPGPKLPWHEVGCLKPGKA